ncbi:SAF domain-containing protein [Cryptosporangium phraense]|uniref:SAF domain-containing protein n=1 Tax=Cryptosporangium phraense TaxID=2593070 RepID=UPI0014788FAB|nr:SAF domain-containing protein [Cryptosporangium phraense]
MLVLVCALGSAYWWSQTSGRVAVLAVATDVPAGRVLTDRDVRTVQVAADATVPLVAAGQRQEIVGRTAAVPLAAGTLLSPQMLGTPVPPEAGQAVVAVSVDPGRFPPSLTAGSTVTVVATGATGAGAPTTGPTTTSQPGEPGQRWPGIVLASAPAADGRGGAVVTLRMAAADATDVAAAGPVALVERHPGEN